MPLRGNVSLHHPQAAPTPGSYQVGARVTVDAEEADWPRDPVGSFFVEAGDF